MTSATQRFMLSCTLVCQSEALMWRLHVKLPSAAVGGSRFTLLSFVFAGFSFGEFFIVVIINLIVWQQKPDSVWRRAKAPKDCGIRKGRFLLNTTKTQLRQHNGSSNPTPCKSSSRVWTLLQVPTYKCCIRAAGQHAANTPPGENFRKPLTAVTLSVFILSLAGFCVQVGENRH